MRNLFLPVLLSASVSVFAEVLVEPTDAPTIPATTELAEPADQSQTEYQAGLTHYQQGQYDASIFALERALAIEPAFHDARLAIIRAYIATGEYVSANVELDGLTAVSLSDAQRQQTTTLKQAALQGMEKGRRKWQGSIALGAGSDSNINAGPDATSNDQYDAAALINGTQSLDDSFAELSADIQYTQFTDGGRVWFGGGRVHSRMHSQESDFDTLLLAAFAGLIFEAGDDTYKISALAQQAAVQGQGSASGDQQQLGMQGIWKHALGSNRQAGAFLQAASIRYPDQAARDVTQIVAGASWDQQFKSALNLGWSSRLYSAVDQEADASRPDMGRRFNGIQISLDTRPNARNQGYLSLNYQQSDYDAPHQDFHIVREDKLTHLVLGWNHQLGERWMLQPEARYTRNTSTLAVDEFDRSQFMLQARRQF